MKIQIVKTKDTAVIPRKKTSGAAAYDLSTPEEFMVRPGRQKIPLGLRMAIEPGYEAKVEPRSGCSLKGLPVEHPSLESELLIDADVIVGKIDSDYRGEIAVILNSRQKGNWVLPAHSRIAQLTFYKVEDADMEVVEGLDDTDRADGGFGHTGTH